MPLYEYHCEVCGAQFAQRRSIAARDDQVVCPECAATQVTRAMSLFVALARGDGGEARTLGPNACGGCTLTSCSTCGVARPSEN